MDGDVKPAAFSDRALAKAVAEAIKPLLPEGATPSVEVYKGYRVESDTGTVRITITYDAR